MSTVFFDFAPQVLNRIEIWRVGWQLVDRQAVSVFCKEINHSVAGVIGGSILNNDQMLVGLKP